MKLKISNILTGCGLGAMIALQSCTLDEYNPGGFDVENIATDASGYSYLVNQCYFGLERVFYNTTDFMGFTEANSDLWTSKTNTKGESDQFFRFYAGSTNVTYTNTFWNGAYDGIASCNIAIRNVDLAPFTNEAEKNASVAEAHFLRALFYYHLVEMFGGVVMIDESPISVTYSPKRTEPLEIYQSMIMPDIRFAVEWLPVGDDTYDGRPTKKAALGMLAKMALASQQYTDEFLKEGQEAATKLINDCEAGGATYGAYMYPNYEDVFSETNNKTNKEALWKYSINPSGSNNGNYKLNMNDQHFICQLNHFGAREFGTQTSIKAWDGGYAGDYMPTQHLLSLFVQEDGTLDPRFHKTFITEWNANKAYEWSEGDCSIYGKDASKVGTAINIDDPAIKIVMPQDADYATEVANKANSNYVLVDYKDVYDDASKSIIMTTGSTENNYRYYYPSLNKYCSTNYYDANVSKNRFGNMNLILVMRMAEIYLIAAEYDILLDGGGKAMGYINKVRQRAGAKTLSGTANIRTVLDERGRELCGEFTRFYDLKRTGMLKDASYLQSTHPELATYYNANYVLRPIPQAYLDVITNSELFKNPGY